MISASLEKGFTHVGLRGSEVAGDFSGQQMNTEGARTVRGH